MRLSGALLYAPLASVLRRPQIAAVIALRLPTGLAFMLFCASVAGSAAEASEPQRLTIEALTDFPVGVGGGVQAEWSYGLRTSLSLQYLPEAYVSTADTVAQEIGGYDDITSALVRAAAKNSFVFRVHAGWRPFSDLGLYADVGYTLLTLGGDVSTDDLAAAAGVSQNPGEGTAWDLTTTNHFIDLQIGWRFDLAERLSLRIAVGFAFTVASQSTIETAQSDRPNIAAAIAEAGEVYLEDVFTSYVHTPTLTLAVGWDLLR